MTLQDVFLADSPGLREMRRRLVDQEDEVFKMLEREDVDLAVHVRADIPRFRLLNLRQQYGQKRSDAKSDRNLIVTVVAFAILFAKIFGGLDGLITLVGRFMHAMGG